MIHLCKTPRKYGRLGKYFDSFSCACCMVSVFEENSYGSDVFVCVFGLLASDCVNAASTRPRAGRVPAATCLFSSLTYKKVAQTHQVATGRGFKLHDFNIVLPAA